MTEQNNPIRQGNINTPSQNENKNNSPSKILSAENNQRQQNNNAASKLMNDSAHKDNPPSQNNPMSKLMNQEWKSQEDYKRTIVALQMQNEAYRNQLYELGETVNKILDKAKIPNHKTNAPNLQQQLELVKKELHNVNQFIEIYQKELNSLGGKKKQQQLENFASTEELLRLKREELAKVKREVKELSNKNKGLEYRLLDYTKKNKIRTYDYEAGHLKELVNENNNLRNKLEELEQMHRKKEVWLQKNIQNAKNLEIKLRSQGKVQGKSWSQNKEHSHQISQHQWPNPSEEGKLPKISSRYSERALSSLPKMQSQKKIYTKWLQANKGKKNSTLEKQIEDLQKINLAIQDKIKNTNIEIKEIQQQISKVKEKVDTRTEGLAETAEVSKELEPKRKDVACLAVKRLRKIRKDWIGKFQSLRFSDSRVVREQTRLYKVTFNTFGYYQFFYYSTQQPSKRYASKLPFDVSSHPTFGKESSVTVEHPDYIRMIRLKINLKTERITEMYLESNLGIKGEFPNQKPSPRQKSKEESTDAIYDLNIKANQAITTVFGSYGQKLDQKKNIVGVWLEGFGVQVIQDFVEQLI